MIVHIDVASADIEWNKLEGALPKLEMQLAPTMVVKPKIVQLTLFDYSTSYCRVEELLEKGINIDEGYLADKENPLMIYLYLGWHQQIVKNRICFSQSNEQKYVSWECVWDTNANGCTVQLFSPISVTVFKDKEAYELFKDIRYANS